MSIAGTTILVTGASGGIGAAIARELANKQATLLFTGRNEAQLEALAAALRGAGSAIHVLPFDLTAPGAPVELAERALEFTGRLDTLINCAGTQSFGFFSGESPQDTARTFHVNTIAPIALINAVLPHMLSRHQGHLVNVGSIFGSIGFPCFATYSASKFALRGFSEALRRELVGSGVRTTYIAPRFTKTALNGDAATRMATALGISQDDPRDVAASVVAELERGGQDRYLGWPEKLFVRLNSMFPRLVDKSLMKQVAQMRPFAIERRT
ncbi:SDR family oxidoreductase [soil metagenome]